MINEQDISFNVYSISPYIRTSKVKLGYFSTSFFIFAFTASLQCCCCHQPHEEAAAGPLRAGPEAGQHPRHQGHRRVLPNEKPETSWSRQGWAQGARGQRECAGDTSHVLALKPCWTKEPLPPTEDQSEPLRRTTRTYNSWTGKACVPLRACQPEWVCSCFISNCDLWPFEFIIWLTKTFLFCF